MVTWVYTVVMLTAIGSCSLFLRQFQRRLAIPARDKFLLGLAGFVGAMIGAKLPFALVDPNHVFSLATWLSDGKTIMFGIVGGYLAVCLMKLALRIKVRTGDSFAFPVALAVAIGRLACFSAGCCFGVETELPWGVHFANVDSDPGVLRHPIQIYESVFHLTAAITILFAYRKLHAEDRVERNTWDIVFHGNLLKAYIVSYMIYRFFSELIRPEPQLWAGFSVYQVACLIILPVFAAMWIVDVAKRWQLHREVRSR